MSYWVENSNLLQEFDCQKLLLGREIYSKKIIIRTKFTVHSGTVSRALTVHAKHCSLGYWSCGPVHARLLFTTATVHVVLFTRWWSLLLVRWMEI
jgi:hypothetical protein